MKERRSVRSAADRLIERLGRDWDGVERALTAETVRRHHKEVEADMRARWPDPVARQREQDGILADFREARRRLGWKSDPLSIVAVLNF
jgi:hypothetical protein